MKKKTKGKPQPEAFPPHIMEKLARKIISDGPRVVGFDTPAFDTQHSCFRRRK